MSNVTPNTFTGKLKVIRHRASTLAVSGAGSHELRNLIVALVDAILLEAKDEYKEEFTHRGAIPGSSPETPLDMSPNVRHMTGITQHVQPTQAPVVMIPAGHEPIAERPSIIAQPEGTPPHVQLSQSSIVGTPGVQHLPPGTTLPPAGNGAAGLPTVELLDHALPMIPPGGAPVAPAK